MSLRFVEIMRGMPSLLVPAVVFGFFFLPTDSSAGVFGGVNNDKGFHFKFLRKKRSGLINPRVLRQRVREDLAERLREKDRATDGLDNSEHGKNRQHYQDLLSEREDIRQELMRRLGPNWDGPSRELHARIRKEGTTPERLPDSEKALLGGRLSMDIVEAKLTHALWIIQRAQVRSIQRLGRAEILDSSRAGNGHKLVEEKAQLEELEKEFVARVDELAYWSRFKYEEFNVISEFSTEVLRTYRRLTQSSEGKAAVNNALAPMEEGRDFLRMMLDANSVRNPVEARKLLDGFRNTTEEP